jgi:hypothetical protein
VRGPRRLRKAPVRSLRSCATSARHTEFGAPVCPKSGTGQDQDAMQKDKHEGLPNTHTSSRCPLALRAAQAPHVRHVDRPVATRHGHVSMGRRVVRRAAASARPHLTMAKSSCVSATRRGAAAAGAPSAPLSEASTSACVAPLSSAGRPSALTCARGPPGQPRGRRVARGPAHGAQRPAACLPCLLIPWQLPRTAGTAGRPARLDRCRCCATGRSQSSRAGRVVLHTLSRGGQALPDESRGCMLAHYWPRIAAACGAERKHCGTTDGARSSAARLGHTPPDQEAVVQRVQLLALRQLVRGAHLGQGRVSSKLILPLALKRAECRATANP